MTKRRQRSRLGSPTSFASRYEARDGSVIELRGDEALAVFRSPRQAIRTAVELQARLLQETLATPDLPLPVGIGLDAGEAVQVEGGYRGGALNLAARLCGQAGPGEILCSQSVVHLARAVEGISYVDRGELHLKGLSDPVHVLAIASDGIDVAERMRALAPEPAGAAGVRGDAAVPRPRAARGGRGQWPDPARRTEAARGPRTSAHPSERARPRRDPGRRGLGRRTAREGPEHHPDLCLAPPEGPRPRPHPEPRTGLPPEARPLRVGRRPVRCPPEGREEGPPHRSQHRGRHARRCVGALAWAGARRPRRPALAGRRGCSARRTSTRGSARQDRGAAGERCAGPSDR